MQTMTSGKCKGFTSVWVTDEDQYTFIEVERPCACSFLCFGKPYADIFQVMEDGNTRERFGRVELGYDSSKVPGFKNGNYLTAFQVRGLDNLGNLQWLLQGSKCDPFYCLPWTSGPCSLSRFICVEADTGKQIAHVYKVFNGVCEGYVTKSNRWIFKFAPFTLWQERVQIIAGIQLLDTAYF
jgi:hypothetical protein